MKLPRNKNGFSLFEILIVFAIIGTIISVFAVINNNSRQTQALRVSSERVADKLREAHIYSREQKDDSAWGVRTSGGSDMSLIRENESGREVYLTSSLEKGVRFDSNYEIKFKPGSGETDNFVTIKLLGKDGHVVEVNVLRSGVIEVGSL